MHIPTTSPAPPGYIDAIDRAHQARAISDADMVALQHTALPKCTPHGRPALGTFNGVRVCELCMLEGRHRI